MKITTIINFCIAILFILLNNVHICESSPLNKLPNIKYDILFGDDNYAYQNKSLTISSTDNNLYIVGTLSLSTTQNRQKKGIWIYGVSDAGEKIVDTRLVNPLNDADKLIDVLSIVNIDDGNIMMIAITETGQYELLKINHKGDSLFGKKLGVERHISKIIPTKDNKYLFIGHKSLKSLVIKIDSSGNELWSKVYDRGQNDMAVDGISTEDGGFVLIENSGKVENFFMGTADIFITKYNANGEKVNEKFLPGRYGNLARAQNGNFVIVYDKSVTAAQDIRVQAYDKDLTPLWNQNITTTTIGLEHFKLVALQNGNYVVAGSVNGKPWITYLDANGAKKWDYLGKEARFGVGTDIACSGSDCYLVSSIVTLNAEKALNNKIKVIKFQPQ